MIGAVVAMVFLIGSVGIMISGILLNQINPNYNSALAVPLFNALGIILALMGLALSLVAYKKNKNLKLAKRIMVLSFACLILLIVLFPFANFGMLSVIN